MEDLIYNQTKIPAQQWRYGFRTSAATGCGWIATYNALRLMGYHPEPEGLIRYYERQLPLIHGNAGTMIQGPAFFFRHHGFSVETLSVTERFDEAVRNADVAIVFYYWRKKFKFGGYNTFRSSSGPDDYGESLERYLKRNGFLMPFLIAIKDKRGL